MACNDDEANLWTVLVLEKCPEVVQVETEVSSEVSIGWTEVELVEEYHVVLGLLLDH